MIYSNGYLHVSWQLGDEAIEDLLARNLGVRLQEAVSGVGGEATAERQQDGKPQANGWKHQAPLC
eukprot:6111237-Pyramimonas_sp.AAC.1